VELLKTDSQKSLSSREPRSESANIPAEKHRNSRENDSPLLTEPKKTPNLACCAVGKKSETRENPEKTGQIRCTSKPSASRNSAIIQLATSGAIRRTGKCRMSVLLLAVAFSTSVCFSADDTARKDEKSANVAKEPEHQYGASLDGKGRTSMFGIEASGYKFVYVIDRSGSMGGDGNAALKAAKAELLGSIKKLESTHAFQIVFYNERPAVFNPTGNGLAVFANDRNKDLAERFLDSISAQGGTEHEAALRIAFKLKPDVIFWLTDADRPKLDDEQIARINRLASGTIINAIEFGTGPKKEEENFLKKIAEGNAGEHVYVDVTKLGKQEPPHSASPPP
jgi:hypothetical protein